jgi:hypothetical protein
MDLSAADRHDEWNLRAIGALNVLHAGYWLQLIPGSGAVVTALFAADVGYLVADLGWLIFSPQCVQPSVRRTLLIHHGLVICCVPLAAGRIVLMRHLLRTWIVELHSWVHIAARRLQWAWAREQLRRANKPIYCALRLVGFPLTWVAYSRGASLRPKLHPREVNLSHP